MSAKVRSKQSGNSGFIIALVAIVAAGGGFIVWKTQQPPPAMALVLPTMADSVIAKQARGYTIGSPTATVEIIEFADYECPACGNYATITEPDVRKNLVDAGIVRYTFYDFPLLNAHQNTVVASMAASCASDQDKFWPMHDALFTNQFEWSGVSTKNPRGVITSYARQVGLDLSTWNACMDANAHAKRIEANYALGLTMQVGSTPTFFVNGKKLDRHDYDSIKLAVDSARAAMPAGTPAPVAPTN